MAKQPLISIITVNLNNLEGLRKTMKSVFDQTWKEFEFIVIDGGSNDGSKELIEENKTKIDQWLSEPDKGIYNAMNKGIAKASGEYLLFLNSGDHLFNENVLSRVSEELIRGLDIFYGNVYLMGAGGERELLVFPDKLSFSFFCNSTITHQAAFIKSSLFEDLFYYNEEYQLVSDWEFFICAICKNNASYLHLNFPVVNYDVDGVSGVKNEKLLYEERNEVLKSRFLLFLDDYKELVNGRQKFKSKRLQAFSQLESRSFTRKINSVLFKLFTSN